MLCPYNVEVEEIKAVMLSVDLGNDLEKYAINFLHIHNNARENKEMILSLKNEYHSNKVYVICPVRKKNNVKEYLEQFGEVDEHECTALRPVIFTDYDKYNGDIDYEYGEVVDAIEE